MRQFAGEPQFAWSQIVNCVCAKQVVMPGHFDRGFLHGSGQTSLILKLSPFAVVTVPCSSVYHEEDTWDQP